MAAGPGGQHLALAVVEVGDLEVEVELLRVPPTGPGGGDEVVDALEGRARRARRAAPGGTMVTQSSSDPSSTSQPRMPA